MAKQDKALRERGRKRQKLADTSAHLREGTNEEVLHFEVADLLARTHIHSEVNGSAEAPNETSLKSSLVSQTELELDIVELSSTGDGLAVSATADRVFVVPFSVPGDTVLARIYNTDTSRPYSMVDFLKVIKPSPKREGVTPGCKYFSTCSGCQLQMVSYPEQLAHKKTIVEKAFRNFSGLTPEQVPAVGSTMGSPLQYGYRTKLTPHFDGPYRRKGEDRKFEEVPKIGFTQKGMKRVMDIESCPIGTEIVQAGLKTERAKVAANYKSFRNGATILLRESTDRIPKSSQGDESLPAYEQFEPSAEPVKPTSIEHSVTAAGEPRITLEYPTYTDLKTCVSDNNAFSTEYISKHVFTNRAGSFFQNNNSILPLVTDYILQNCIPPSPILDPEHPEPPIKYLLDAYCGSGLFAVTLSSLFSSALGIDIDGSAIQTARLNAKNNGITNTGFIEADASDLFADVPFPEDQTLVVIDPPRKGASEDFLRQLCKFGPKRVVYVSCNVHTQARDVGMLVDGFGNLKDQGKWRYEIESLRGFDFFPQTGHVEGLCFLNRVSASGSS